MTFDPKEGWIIGAPAPEAEAPPEGADEAETDGAPQPREPVPGAAPPQPLTPESVADAPAEAEIYRGTGMLLNEMALPRSSLDIESNGDITLNFVNADVREVVRTVFGSVLGENYVIDPAVSGTVTVQTSRPIAREAVLPTLEAVLLANGAALIEADGLYTIVPRERAAERARGVEFAPPAGAQPPGYSIRVVPLAYVGAEEMQTILERLAPEGSILHVDRQRNVLILAGTRVELAPLLETVDIFDVDWMKGMSFGLFHLDYVDVATLADELAPVFGTSAGGPLAGLVRLVPIERMNALLAISPQPAYLDQVQQWVDRLDRQTPGVDQRLFVYFVQHGKAADLADVLKQVFQPEDAEEAPSPLELAPGMRPSELRRAPSRPAVPAPTALTTEAESGEAAPPVAAAPALATGAAGAGIQLAAGSPIRIIADDKRNALLVSATARDYRMIEAALKRLDTIPLQVLLEATIMEVQLRDQLQYGLQWFFQTGNHKVTFSTAASGAVAETFPGFSYFFSLNDKAVALNALTSLTDVNVVSSPQLMVLNNQTATIQVGDQVPIATQSAVSIGDPDAPIVNTIQFRDTGVILQVTPRVNNEGYVMLEIQQEVSDVVETTTSGIDSPTIQQRKINSTIAVRSGETIALGGLITDTRNVTKSGLPGLSRIPILGALFSSTNDDARRTELLILVVPRIVRNDVESRRVTDELRRRIRAVEPLAEKIR